MEAEYKRDLNHAYMILESPQQIDPAAYQIRMIVKNQPEGFLKCSIHMLDNRPLFYYDITSRQSLRSLYAFVPIPGNILRLLYESTIGAIEVLESFLLDTSGLILNPEMIYLDMGKEAVYFCYLPGNGEAIGESFERLTEYLLQRLDHTQPEAVVMGYGVYRQAMEETFDTETFRAILSRDEGICSKQEEEKTQREELLDSLFLEEAQEKTEKTEAKFWAFAGAGGGFLVVMILLIILIALGVLPAWSLLFVLLLLGAVAGATLQYCKKEGLWKKQVDPIRINPEMDSVWEPEEPEQKREETYEAQPTVLMGTRREVRYPYLEALSREESGIYLLKEENTTVGKLKDAGLLPSSSAVSRIHARIYREGEECYLEDMNSKNGTYLNEELLSPGKRYRLCNEDCIRFADAEYCFRKPDMGMQF